MALGREGRDSQLTREEFSGRLAGLKASSSHSYAQLGGLIGRPTSTVHGWITGRHLPYQRDNDAFFHLLSVLGADDTAQWQSALTNVRRCGSVRAGENRYRAPEDYSEIDDHLFLGRSALAQEIVSKISASFVADHSVPVVVVGASDLGAASLMRAGAMPLLVQQGFEVEICTPRDDPGSTFSRLIERNKSGTGKRVVIVDQFEETLTNCGPANLLSVLELVEELAALDQVQLVIGVRADFFDRLTVSELVTAGLRDKWLAKYAQTT